METDGSLEIRLSVTDIAKLFGVSVRAIANWASEGMPFVRVKGKVNRYPWRPCLEWWLANKYTGVTAKDKDSPQRTPSKVESEAKILVIKAEREQMRLDVEKGNLIRLEDIEPAWVQAAAIVKDRVLGMPAVIKMALPSLSAENLAKIRQVCRETLEAIEKCPQSKD